jgi:hypothetical protein
MYYTITITNVLIDWKLLSEVLIMSRNSTQIEHSLKHISETVTLMK